MQIPLRNRFPDFRAADDAVAVTDFIDRAEKETVLFCAPLQIGGRPRRFCAEFPCAADAYSGEPDRSAVQALVQKLVRRECGELLCERDRDDRLCAVSVKQTEFFLRRQEHGRCGLRRQNGTGMRPECDDNRNGMGGLRNAEERFEDLLMSAVHSVENADGGGCLSDSVTFQLPKAFRAQDLIPVHDACFPVVLSEKVK